MARALGAAGALCALGLLALAVVPSYAGAMREFLTLPWRALLSR